MHEERRGRVSLDEALQGRGGISGGEALKRRRGVTRLRRLSGDSHEHRAVGVRRGPLHHRTISTQRHEVRVVGDRWGPSLRQELRVRRVHEVVVGEAAVIGQKPGWSDDPGDGVRAQAVTVEAVKLGFVAVAVGVFESERS